MINSCTTVVGVFGNILFRESPQVINTVLINVGKKDFNHYDDKKFIVIDVNGNLVGRIVELGNNNSIVQLINDVNNKVIVEDRNNMLKSALMLPISYNKGELYGVTRQDSLSLGDTLYTSTKSDVYIDRIAQAVGADPNIFRTALINTYPQLKGKL